MWLFLLVTFVPVVLATETDGYHLRLAAPLDEPEFYCLDVAGWGERLQLNDPLQAHTCKMGRPADQLFRFSSGRLEVSAYARCVQVTGSSGKTLAGSAVIARKCSDSPLQKLSLGDDGRVRVGDSNWCLGVGDRSAEASGPSHLWRTLSVVHCKHTNGALQAWQIGLAESDTDI